MGHIIELLNHYGYIVLFIALTLELIGFPTPGETFMTYCGFLVYQGKLNWTISIAASSVGVISGITISYLIGRILGKSFFVKYGTRIHLGPERLEKTSKWFDKHGNGLLAVAYFVPGIRHITGYFSGISKIPYKRFAINAYIGAFLWTGTFISLGKVLGSNWEKFHGSIKKYLIIGGIIVGAILLCVYLYRSHKHKIAEFITNSLGNSLKVFHSLGKIRISVLGVAVAFISFSILAAGLIQDFLANEFSQFDAIAAFLVSTLFDVSWTNPMKLFGLLTSYQILIAITVFLILWIVIKGKNRSLEIRFLLITVLGGEILEELLRVIFHRLGPLGMGITNHSRYTFPSEQSIMTLVTYGFAAFILIRHANKKWMGSSAVIFALIICVVSGLSPLFFKIQYPSDVTAGYAFGGIWLSLNIILLEVFRILPEIKHT